MHDFVTNGHSEIHNKAIDCAVHCRLNLISLYTSMYVFRVENNIEEYFRCCMYSTYISKVRVVRKFAERLHFVPQCQVGKVKIEKWRQINVHFK